MMGRHISDRNVKRVFCAGFLLLYDVFVGFCGLLVFCGHYCQYLTHVLTV